MTYKENSSHSSKDILNSEVNDFKAKKRKEMAGKMKLADVSKLSMRAYKRDYRKFGHLKTHLD